MEFEEIPLWVDSWYRPSNGPAGNNAPQRAGSEESTQSGTSSNSTSSKVAYRYQKRTYPVLSKEAGVSEYANFKEEWLKIPVDDSIGSKV